MNRPAPSRRTGAFTLIEIAMALAGAAIVLAAVFGIFSKAVQLRNTATERTRESRVQARALNVLRQDLRNALFSGGVLAAQLAGSATAPDSSFPGYLKFTATNARMAGEAEETLAADIHEVSYYVGSDPDSADRTAGRLIRATRTNLLSTTDEEANEETLLPGVDGMEVAFYDGQDWKPSWELTDEERTLPMAVRVRVQLAATAPGEAAPAPLEVLVPWTTQPAIDPPATAAAAAPAAP